MGARNVVIWSRSLYIHLDNESYVLAPLEALEALEYHHPHPPFFLLEFEELRYHALDNKNTLSIGYRMP